MSKVKKEIDRLLDSAIKNVERGHDVNFIAESNRIEGINRPPTLAEYREYKRFMALKNVTIYDLQLFVEVYQPDASLRERVGQDVFIGTHMPPRGGPEIRIKLDVILESAVRGQLLVTKGQPDSAWQTHIAYEHLHPFTDGNGRSGRMLWAWQMRRFPLGFLHQFYYQTLAGSK